MRMLLFIVIVIGMPMLPTFGDQPPSVPKTNPPLFGTAFVNDAGKELKVDEYRLVWELTVKIPIISPGPFEPAFPSSSDQNLPRKLQGAGTRKVQVRLCEIRVQHRSLDQTVQLRVVDVHGKSLSRDQVLARLKKETPVWVSLNDELPDDYFLRLARPDSLVVIFGPGDKYEY